MIVEPAMFGSCLICSANSKPFMSGMLLSMIANLNPRPSVSARFIVSSAAAPLSTAVGCMPHPRTMSVSTLRFVALSSTNNTGRCNCSA